MNLLNDLISRLLGRSKPSGFREIDCDDGAVVVNPSDMFDGHIALQLRPDAAPRPPMVPILLRPHEAREVASALVAAALEVDRDG